MQAMRAAADERDLYQLKGLPFEKLQGARQYQHSLRLNGQWRLSAASCAALFQLLDRAPPRFAGIAIARAICTPGAKELDVRFRRNDPGRIQAIPELLGEFDPLVRREMTEVEKRSAHE